VIPTQAATVRPGTWVPSLPLPPLLFLASIAMAISFMAILPGRFQSNENSDYRIEFEPVARNVMAGRGISDAKGRVAVRHPPGYPVTLAGLFGLARIAGLSEAAAISAFGVLCFAASTVQVYALANLIWASHLAVVAWMAWATYPLALWFLKQPNSELPFLVLLYAALYVFLSAVLQARPRLGRFMLAGALIGLAMLFRQIAMFVPLALAAALWMAWRHSPARRVWLPGSAALCLGAALALLPWHVYVLARSGRVVAITAGSEIGVRDGLTFAVRSKGFREPLQVSPRVEALMRRFSAQYERIQPPLAAARAVVVELRRDPRAVAELFGLKIVRAWYATDSHRYELHLLALQALYLPLCAWGAWAARRHSARARCAAVVVLAVVGCFWGMSAAINPLMRYMVPGMGLLFVLLPGVFVRARSASFS
jgi:hypothetical protein